MTYRVPYIKQILDGNKSFIQFMGSKVQYHISSHENCILKPNMVSVIVSWADPLSWILQKDPLRPKDEWNPSTIFNYRDLPDWQPHYLVWFLSLNKLFCWINWANCHLQPCALYFYTCHTTYTKMCRLLLIHKTLVPSHHIGHIYDVTTFQTIVMSQVALWHHHVHCLLLLLSWHHCWCH